MLTNKKMPFFEIAFVIVFIAGALIIGALVHGILVKNECESGYTTLGLNKYICKKVEQEN